MGRSYLTSFLLLTLPVFGVNAQSCIEEGYFPDSNDCTKFYRCVSNSGHNSTTFRKYEFSCPAGTSFDVILSNCNFPYASQCEMDGNPEESETLNNLRDCITGFGVPSKQLVDQRTNKTYYEFLNRQWNLAIPKVYPLAYFLPLSTEDVQIAVVCAVDNKIAVIPNSGGHSYVASSFKEDTVIIDFRNMTKISINKEDSTTTIQPGALVGPINAYLWENGGYAIPMGNCLTVGLGGHAIGGGIGYYGTMFGLASDNLVEVTMVDAKGTNVVANKDENSDLFWALRGIGPGYIGIVTSLKLKMFPASELQLTFVQLRYGVKRFAEIMDAYQTWLKWVDENEPTVMSGFYIVSDTYDAKYPPLEPGIEFQIVHYHHPTLQPKGNSSFLDKVREAFPANGQTNIYFPSYINFVKATGYAPVVIKGKIYGSVPNPLYGNKNRKPHPDTPTLSSLRKDMSYPRYMKAKSLFVHKFASLSDIEKLGGVVQRIPKNNVWIMVATDGGAMRYPAPNDTAYVHRRGLYDITIHYEGSDNEKDVQEGVKFVEDMWEALQVMDGGESYQNYPDLDTLKPAFRGNRMKRYYGENFGRLESLKREWDPANYFQSELSI